MMLHSWDIIVLHASYIIALLYTIVAMLWLVFRHLGYAMIGFYILCTYGLAPSCEAIQEKDADHGGGGLDNEGWSHLLYIGHINTWYHTALKLYLQ